MLELGDGEVGRAYLRPAVWTTDIQEKNAIALIRQTFEIRLDCTIKQALQGCRQPRTEERMRKVGGCGCAGSACCDSSAGGDDTVLTCDSCCR